MLERSSLSSASEPEAGGDRFGSREKFSSAFEPDSEAILKIKYSTNRIIDNAACAVIP